MNGPRIMDALDDFMDWIENHMERFGAQAIYNWLLSDLIADLTQAAKILNPQDLLTLLGRAQDLLRRYAPDSKYHRAVQDMICDAEQAQRSPQGGEKSTA